MKKILIAVILLIYIPVFSQNDSTVLFKNEISIYANMFQHGFGAQYAHWNRPRHYFSFGIDFNNIIKAKDESYRLNELQDSVLKVHDFTNSTFSMGIRLGYGCKVNTKPTMLLSGGFITGLIEKNTVVYETIYNVKKDSLLHKSMGGISEQNSLNAAYGGAYGSITLLADISRTLKIYASANFDFCYIYYYKNDYIPSEYLLRGKVSVGLKYFF